MSLVAIRELIYWDPPNLATSVRFKNGSTIKIIRRSYGTNKFFFLFISDRLVGLTMPILHRHCLHHLKWMFQIFI